ncbi:MAG: RnfABCDGE type electron transport complex subunit A [Candidatus Omnitrophica bacterium]|nr:RnfABCDGE type electron transport complex subunit A [Candidatus Omnitrophota bacterium]
MDVNFNKILTIIISMVFVNNFILSKFLGLCPFIGVSRRTKPALSMGAAVIFVMTGSSIITWLLYRYILVPFHVEYLRTVSFILVIATFVQFVEMFTLKNFPALYETLGIYLPLITTNCAVLGVAVLNINDFFMEGYSVLASFSYSVIQAFFAGVGFTLALFLMSAIRERLDLAEIPECFKGVPIAFIVASLMSLAFMGFTGFRF